MKAILRAIACLSCACLTHASEIVAWKVPLASYSWRHSGPENQTRLTKPPEASLFFHPGDELWDLGKLPKNKRIETDPPLEWVVWNATTSTLVTKSDWNGVWQLHQQFRVSSLPKLCRVTLEVFEVPKDDTPFSDKSIQLSKLSWTSRFQTKTEVKDGTDGRSIQAMAEPSIRADRFDFIDLVLETTMQLPAFPKLGFKTSLLLENDQPTWIARDFDGKQGVDLRITASVEMTDGTPVRDAMRLQVGNEIKSLVPTVSEPMRHRIGENRWLCLVPLSMEELAVFDQPTANEMESDPFAEPPLDQPKKSLKLTEVDVPKALHPWVGSRALDLNETMRNTGITINPEDFAGYDPIGSTIYFYSGSEREIDKFEALFATLGGDRFPALSRLHLEENPGQTVLAACSGRNSSLTRYGKENKLSKCVEIQPVVGEKGDLIDLRIYYENKANKQLGTLFNASSTLSVGQYQDLLTGSDGKPLLRAKAEIIRP